jgi:diguanylate cyclase (GGDEF)-like protein
MVEVRWNLKSRKDIPPDGVDGFNSRMAHDNMGREQLIAFLVIGQYFFSFLWVVFTHDVGALLSEVVPKMAPWHFFGAVFFPPFLTVGISLWAPRCLHRTSVLFFTHRLNLCLLIFGAAFIAILVDDPFVFETVILLSSLLVTLTPLFSRGLYTLSLLFFLLGSVWSGGWQGFSWFDIGDVVTTTLVGFIMVRFRFSDRVGGYLKSCTIEAQHRQLQATNRELTEANAHLRAIARLDGLTGVSNRRAFDEALDREWRRAMRTGGTLGLLMIDIDFFKPFNDTYGHQAGDECLRRVAEALRTGARRGGDMVARYGGEEFAVLLPCETESSLRATAEALRKKVADLGVSHGASDWGHVSISTGGAMMSPQSGEEADILVAQADGALYAAKDGGRNRVEVRGESGVNAA